MSFKNRVYPDVAECTHDLLEPLKALNDEIEKHGGKIYRYSAWGGVFPLFGWNATWSSLAGSWDDSQASIIVGYDEEIRLARGVEVLEIPMNHTRTRYGSYTNVIVVFPEDVKDGTKADKLLNELVAAGCPKIYDTREESCRVTSRITGITSYGRTHRIPIFTGDVSEYFAASYVKTMMVAYASQVWKGHRLHDVYGVHSALTTLKRSKNLANGMLLGHTKVVLSTGAGSGSQFSAEKRDMLMFAEMNITNATGKVAKSLDTLRKFQDVSLIWDKCLENHHLSITMSEDELADWDTCSRIFNEIAKHTGIDRMVELYFAGIPVEDLVG